MIYELKFLQILCVFSIALISGCDQKTVSELANDQFVYEIYSSTGKSGLSVQQAVLTADSSGRLYLHLRLLNRSENQISLSSPDWELKTASGLRSSPINIKDSLTLLMPGSTYIRDFTFEPINSLKLYHLTGFKGDLGSQYKVMFKQDLTIDFRLSDAQYKLYIEKWSMEKELIVFIPDIQPDFVKKEAEYLTKNTRQSHDDQRIEHGANVSEQEILIDGLNADFSSYTWNDTLTIEIRLTNHSPFTASITSSWMQIRLDSSITLEPIMIDGIDYQEVPRSQRAAVRLKYLLPPHLTSGFALDVSSLTFHISKPVPAFYQKWISFKKNNI